MKLYFGKGACSLAPHIALREAGLPFTLAMVDLATHKLADGRDYTAINPKGYVPTLELDDGTRLTEVAVILQYIADRAPGKLAPAFGGFERYRLMETLNFIATEVHKGFSPLWKPDTPDATRATAKATLARRFGYLTTLLGDRNYVFGDDFTIADAYLFTVLRWSGMLQVDLGAWPALVDYVARIDARPAVQAALKAERDAAKVPQPA